MKSRTRAIVSLAVMTVASALFTGAPSPSNAAFPGQNGRIFFFRQTNNSDVATGEIYSMKPDGADKERLTNNDVLDEDPSPSANGRWVVFERAFGADADIMRMKPNGNRVKRLTHTAPSGFVSSNPAFSPNGNKIVFNSDRNGDEDQLFLMNFDGSNEVPLTEPVDADDGNPRWSPNGDWIVFDREFDVGAPERKICKIRPNGNGEVCLTGGEFNQVEDPDWSPNSRKIVFEGIKSTGNFTEDNIFVMRRDGSGVKRLTARDNVASDPAYSPNGARIIFELEDQAPNSLFIMNADGSNEHRVTPASFDVQDPEWSVKP
jgi:TolB protein